MIYITGDVHIPYDVAKLGTEKLKDTTKDDYLIICGDFGLLWNWTEQNQSVESNPEDTKWTTNELFWKKHLENLPYTILFVDGNHENFDRLNGYPITEWNGGKVQKISDSIIHLMRGQVYEIDGKKIFTFGGAASHDRGIATGTENIDEGVCWWPVEICNQRERDEAVKNLAEHNNKVDIIITHCLPDKQVMKLGFSEFNATTTFLWNIEEMVDFQKWYCGHYHRDEWVSTKIRILYNEIVTDEGEKVYVPLHSKF